MPYELRAKGRTVQTFDTEDEAVAGARGGDDAIAVQSSTGAASHKRPFSRIPIGIPKPFHAACSEIPLAATGGKLAFERGFHAGARRVQNYLFLLTDRKSVRVLRYGNIDQTRCPVCAGIDQ